MLDVIVWCNQQDDGPQYIIYCIGGMADADVFDFTLCVTAVPLRLSSHLPNVACSAREFWPHMISKKILRTVGYLMVLSIMVIQLCF